MNRDAIVSLSVATLCVVAVGVSAAALDASVSTNPDDVINLHWKNLPLSEQQASDMKHEIQANTKQLNGDPSAERQPAPAPSVRNEQRQRQSQGSGPVPPDLLDRLLAFLESLLPVLGGLVLLAVAALLARRYRERLAGLVEPSDDGGDDPVARLPLDASDDIDRAWLAMVGRLDVDRPTARTPAELERAAVAAGLDPEAVETVTSLFVTSHYGATGTTEGDRSTARRLARRFVVSSSSGPGGVSA